MLHLRLRFVFLLLFPLVLSTLSGQTDTQLFDRFPLPDNGGELKNPEAYFGWEVGTRFTEYARSVEYFNYLAANSDRVDLAEYGKTYEQRPLLVLTISDPANLARVDEIKATQQAMTTAYGLSAAKREALPANQPVINSYSFNIHGNEASGTEAAMQLAYHLASTGDRALVEALKTTVNLLFVCINPDGRDRYVYWANSVAASNTGINPSELEHYAPWPNGRTNHYWFDLNRDWIWGIHPESRGQIAVYQEWLPSVHTDYHEQGYDANYFTVPGTTPRNLLLPQAYEMWADTFGRANATAFDAKGLSYFTRDRFDFYYPSYGSSYPTVLGAIGMLTEQGGIGAGRAVTTEDGYELHLRQRVFDHYTTALEQVKTAARNHRALQEYSMDAWNPATSLHNAKAYLIENDGNPYLADFTNILLRNGIEVRRTTQAFSGTGVDYRSNGTAQQREYAAGSLLITTDQPRHLLVNTLLSQTMEIEDSVMYDMATWSAPLAYNLAAHVFNSPVRVQTEAVPLATSSTKITGVTADKTYAYIVDYKQRHAPKFLAQCWQQGYRVRSAHQSFTDTDGRTFSAGALIILTGRNLKNRARPQVQSLEQIAQETGVDLHRAGTGRMASGQDLGSTRNFPVRQPKAALLVEPPFNTYTSGQLYFLFDQETELPVDRIRASLLEETSIPKFGSRYGNVSLNDYNVLILPDSRNLKLAFDSVALAKVMAWVEAGGTLITIGNTAEFFAKATTLKILQAGKDTSAAAATLAYTDRTDYRGKKNVPGSALHGSLDVTHPLAYGLPSSVYTLKFGSNAIQPNNNLASVGRYGTDASSLLAAGYAPDEALQRLAGNTWAGVLPTGRGKIVYFLDNPHYRMFWRGPSRMMQNAVMVVPGM